MGDQRLKAHALHAMTKKNRFGTLARPVQFLGARTFRRAISVISAVLMP
jgi:hypothetical protein